MKLQQTSWTGKDVIEIRYGNGSVFTGDCMTLPENIYQPCDAARHGIAQKLGDAKSGGTAAEKYAEVLLIWDSMKGPGRGNGEGSWNRKGQSGGVESFVERAYEILAQTAGQKPEQAAAWFEAYKTMPEEKQAEIRAKGFMKAAIESARAEKKLAGSATDKTFNPNA